MTHKRSFALFLTALALPLLAQAHISIHSGPAPAGVTDVVVFGVGHGCEVDGASLDTTSVTVDIPSGVTSVRPELSGFDAVSVETDDTGAVVGVTWSKNTAWASDIAFYELKLRMKAPDLAFSRLALPAHQTCTSEDGETETVVDWTGEEGEEDAEPAPYLYVVPEHFPGWNKFTPEEDIEDLDGFFHDALIVWQGSKAFSSNPTTVELISGTEGVTPLTAIAAGEEIWVRY